jgi:hypothetical protein
LPAVAELCWCPRPLERREIIRKALEQQDWRVAANNLHQAHTRRECLNCGLRSQLEYVETLGISRMHNWRLRLIARSGHAEVGYTYRGALKYARRRPSRCHPGEASSLTQLRTQIYTGKCERRKGQLSESGVSKTSGRSGKRLERLRGG